MNYFLLPPGTIEVLFRSIFLAQAAHFTSAALGETG
jgi:hypothetical protein